MVVVEAHAPGGIVNVKPRVAPRRMYHPGVVTENVCLPEASVPTAVTLRWFDMHVAVIFQFQIEAYAL